LITRRPLRKTSDCRNPLSAVAVPVLPAEELFVYVYVRIRDLMPGGAVVVPDRPGPVPACTGDVPPHPVVDIGELSQRCRQGSQIPKSFPICDSGASPLRATATTSRQNSVGKAFGALIILPARTNPHGQGVSSAGGSPWPSLSRTRRTCSHGVISRGREAEAGRHSLPATRRPARGDRRHKLPH
jgi:hypothetical protein